MIEVRIAELAGNFAENKDIAKEIRENTIIPAIASGEVVVLRFDNVDSTTQSFIHALISGVFHTLGEPALDLLEFKKCNRAVKSLIATVINYSLE